MTATQTISSSPLGARFPKLQDVVEAVFDALGAVDGSEVSEEADGPLEAMDIGNESDVRRVGQLPVVAQEPMFVFVGVQRRYGQYPVDADAFVGPTRSLAVSRLPPAPTRTYASPSAASTLVSATAMRSLWEGE